MGEELAIPGTGELVNLEDEVSCALALAALRDFETQIREAKGILTNAIVERSRTLGTKTLYLPTGGKVERHDGSEVVWDIEELEAELRSLGLPEERLSDLIKETVTRTVDGRIAKSIASANEDYAAVIASAKTVTEKAPYVTIKR